MLKYNQEQFQWEDKYDSFNSGNQKDVNQEGLPRDVDMSADLWIVAQSNPVKKCVCTFQVMKSYLQNHGDDKKCMLLSVKC